MDGILVQEMVPPGAVEVIVGSTNDSEFGPMVVFGLGGITVELLRDSTLRPAPVELATAREMITEIRGSALLRGFRARPETDIEALAVAIVALSRLAYEFRTQIAEVDINPLMVLPNGCGVRAVDALIVKRHSA